ncbi:MAG TPA: WecB/TagA/CpsF family glycosyltransferase [Candidatus Saccharimonadales bacterium]|nr:WecB/TagA/CpsF family glycosyltransferase [Candidatus Saccharimonadales bacterium]
MPTNTKNSPKKTNRKIIQTKGIEKNSTIEKKSYNADSSLVKSEILGVGVTNASKENILEFIANSLENSQENYYVTTPNPEMLVYAMSHPELRSILNNAEIALCDGVGVRAGASFLGKPLIERFTGVDAVEMLCEKVSNRPITVGFFGGGPKVAEMTAQCLKDLYPSLKVVYASDVWADDQIGSTEALGSTYYVPSKTQEGVQGTNTTRYITPNPKIDILFVALGFPKQELWMAQHLNKIPVRIMVGVGGAFDYISGKVPRAPKVIRSLGMEWLFRLFVQPWRLKRQLALPQFIWLVLREKLKR